MYLLTREEVYDILHNEELMKAHIVNNSNVKEDEIAKKAYLMRAQCPLSDYTNLKHYVVFTTNN